MCTPQEQKTVAVMSVSSIDGILGNIGYLTEAAGSPEYGQMVSMMSGAYLEGVDRGNPVGMILNTDGQEFVPLGFFPVTDLDKVLTVLEDSVGSPRNAGNGIKEIPGPQPMFVKEKTATHLLDRRLSQCRTASKSSSTTWKTANDIRFRSPRQRSEHSRRLPELRDRGACKKASNQGWNNCPKKIERIKKNCLTLNSSR